MKKVETHAEVISKYFNIFGKVLIDGGCGSGDFARWMTTQGASVIGIDAPEIITKAEKIEKVGDEKYIAGTGQVLPFGNKYADLIVCLAGFHHIPEDETFHALEQCPMILKSGGSAVFIEPVAQKGSYCEIVRLEQEAKKLKQEMDKLVRLHLDGEMPMEGLGNHYRLLEDRLKQIEGELPDLQGEIDYLKIQYLSSDEILNEAKELYERWPTLEQAENQNIIDTIIKKLEFTTNNGQRVKPESSVVRTPRVICNQVTSGGVLGCKIFQDIQKAFSEPLPLFESVPGTQCDKSL